MLTKEQRELLENLLESLNRLFDRDSTATDIYSLLFATALAVRGSNLSAAVEAPLAQLRDLVHSKDSQEGKRNAGLALTDELRKFVADQLRKDSIENPKKRHI
jgi:hypothetical protein